MATYQRNGVLEMNPDILPERATNSLSASGSVVAGALLFSPDERHRLQGVLQHLRQLVHTQGILVKMHMKDYDKANRGIITETRFQRVLSTIFPSLAPADTKLLARAFSTGSGDGTCHYTTLHREVTEEESKDAPSPTAAATAAGGPVAPISPAATLSAGFLSDNDADAVEAAVVRRVWERRIRLDAIFLDWDKLKRGKVTRNQFVRGLTGAGLGLAAGVSPQGLDALASRYALPDDNDTVSYSAFALSTERAFCEPNMHTHAGPPPDSFAHTVVTGEHQSSIRPVFDASRSAALELALKTIMVTITRRRVYDIKPRFVDFDPVNEGLVTEARFGRTLATLGLVPDSQEGFDAVLDFFRDARKPEMISYRAFLLAVAPSLVLK